MLYAILILCRRRWHVHWSAVDRWTNERGGEHLCVVVHWADVLRRNASHSQAAQTTGSCELHLPITSASLRSDSKWMKHAAKYSTSETIRLSYVGPSWGLCLIFIFMWSSAMIEKWTCEVSLILLIILLFLLLCWVCSSVLLFIFIVARDVKRSSNFRTSILKFEFDLRTFGIRISDYWNLRTIFTQ